MPTERELAISPIVNESVQHNTQVGFSSLGRIRMPIANKLVPPDRIQHPHPDCLAFRHCIWHSRVRIISRLSVLHPRYLLRLLPYQHHPRQKRQQAIFPECLVGVVGWRCVRGSAELCFDMDTVLRTMLCVRTLQATPPDQGPPRLSKILYQDGTTS